MPGLIDGLSYAKIKAKLCAESEHLANCIDAIEWELLQAVDFSIYPLVDAAAPGEFRSHQIPGGVAVVFGFEHADGEKKVHLIGLWIPEPPTE